MGRERKTELPCAECGVMFMPSKNQWDKRKRSRIFCSRTCLSDGNRKSSVAWWTANPDTNTVRRPTVNCAYCQKEFTASPSQHQKLVKKPDANVYCTRECLFLNTGHTQTREYALRWVQDHPEVGGKQAAELLGIPYPTLHYWRKKAGLPIKKFEYRTTKNCGYCGEEFWPSSAQWHQRKDYEVQVCSDKCHRELLSHRNKGVPRHHLRKHGLYSIEMEQVKQIRKAIHKFIEEGANQ